MPSSPSCEASSYHLLLTMHFLLLLWLQAWSYLHGVASYSMPATVVVCACNHLSTQYTDLHTYRAGVV